MYESTGGLGESLIIRYNPFTGEIDQIKKLGKDIFGEGITLVDDQTFSSHLAERIRNDFETNQTSILFNPLNIEDLEKVWGLTHDDDFIYKSDGSELIWRLSKVDASEVDYLTISSQNSYFKNANELELYGDLILSNVYQKDSVMVIDKNTGAILGVLDLSSLKKLIDKDDAFDPLNSVLNGIAYHKERKNLLCNRQKLG